MTDVVTNRLSEPIAALDFRFRLLGALPLLFFLGQLVFYWRDGSLGNMLWMCNIGNLIMALALFAGSKQMIRATALWTIPGLVIWVVFVIVPYGFVISSFFAHVGGFVVAMIVLRTVRVDRRAWLFAFGWYLLMQLVSRLATAADLNVNVAYRIQPGWDSAFSSYWKFWLAMTLAVAGGLWLIGAGLRLLWPAELPNAPSPPPVDLA